MITVPEFQERCRKDDADKIVSEVILAGDAKHVSNENQVFLQEGLASKYGIKSTDLQLWVVGSAKLGFSIAEKHMRDDLGYRIKLPRYRLFSATSDIDVAVVSETIFRNIWDDLCQYANGMPFSPWDSGPLGDYMVYGWLRPDHFPKAGLRRCEDWWNSFYTFSTSGKFNRRKVRGGIFHSLNDLHRYQRRAVCECQNQLI